MSTFGLSVSPPGDFLPNPLHEFFDFAAGMERDVITPLHGVKSCFCCGPQPFELGLVFLFALFEEPQTLTHHFASLNEAVEAIG